MKKTLHWISRALSEENGLPSTRRVLFAAWVALTMAFIGGHMIAKGGFDAQAVDLLKTVGLYTAGAYGVTKTAEAIKGN